MTQLRQRMIKRHHKFQDDDSATGQRHRPSQASRLMLHCRISVSAAGRFSALATPSLIIESGSSAHGRACYFTSCTYPSELSIFCNSRIAWVRLSSRGCSFARPSRIRCRAAGSCPPNKRFATARDSFASSSPINSSGRNKLRSPSLSWLKALSMAVKSDELSLPSSFFSTRKCRSPPDGSSSASR